MNWFFRRILSGMAFGFGFVIAVLVMVASYQHYVVYATKNNIDIFPMFVKPAGISTVQAELLQEPVAAKVDIIQRLLTAADEPVTVAPEQLQKDRDAEHADLVYQRALDYRHGYGVDKNNAEAIKLFLEAANMGNSKAQEQLGYMYRKGFGSPVDYEQSFYWFSKAAAQGSLYAHEGLGRAYLKGYFVVMDYEQAFKHYTLAADGGRGYAMGQLGWMYEKGLYVERSHILSKEWYEKGKKHGDDYSTRRINDGW